ncbi:MAG: hypothetical protein FIA99_07530 [Ruminiclostridium sp.]|nr:hypothetical protein [Ruminiclostridium sp.]
MKFLAKINRGLILSVFVLTVVVIYLVTLSISHAAVIPKIKEVCTNYINTEISYKMLPEKYRKEKPDMPQNELDKYIVEMAMDIKAFYTDNEQTYKYLIDRNKADLENQSKGIGIIFSYKKDIADYKNIVFDGNTVTVTILTNSSFDGPDITAPGMQRGNVSAQTNDTILLQKTDEEWKIIYADLQQPIKNGMGNPGVISRTMTRTN